MGSSYFSFNFSAYIAYIFALKNITHFRNQIGALLLGHYLGVYFIKEKQYF